MTLKAYKYRFYPADEQCKMFAQTFGCVRYVYNWGLQLRQEAYLKDKTKISYHDTSAKLTELKAKDETAWLKDVSSVPLQQCLRHLQVAYTHFFAGRAKYPRFKKKGNRQSAEFTRAAFRFDGKSLYLAKCVEPLDIRWSRKFKGNPSTITISKDSAGRYFISFLVEEVIKPLKAKKKAIGIDLGLTSLIVTSEGKKISPPKYFSKYEKKLARAQRCLAKKQKGSANRIKARLKVAKIHAKISDCRKDFIHKATTRLIRENQTIAVETLAVKNMQKNRYLSKSISDAAWGEILRQLQYKADWYGRELIGVNRWFPSTKRCSHCGHTLDSIGLDVREWECPECNMLHDRDVNAARNILAAGQAVSALGESVSHIS